MEERQRGWHLHGHPVVTTPPPWPPVAAAPPSGPPPWKPAEPMGVVLARMLADAPELYRQVCRCWHRSQAGDITALGEAKLMFAEFRDYENAVR